jgi:class 3 adenylate cyclase
MSNPIPQTSSGPARAGERRQVSLLFSDMVGYTTTVERLGEERSLAFTQMLYAELTRAVLAHGGTVRSFAEDSIMAVFGIPEALEDGVPRACRAALEIQSTFKSLAPRIEAQFGQRSQMRVGISSDVAVMAQVEGAQAEATAVGNTGNLASRIEEIAPAGGCLICDETRALVEWRVALNFEAEHEIRGIARAQKL